MSAMADDDELVWGAVAISEVIHQTPRQTFHLLSKKGALPARKVGGRWVASKRQLLRLPLALLEDDAA
jgi:hypothetical protein